MTQSNTVVTYSNKWILDTREPEEIENLLIKYDIPYERGTLPVGDLAYGHIIIERKTAHDLHNSLVSGRIWEQLKELKLNAETPILMIWMKGKYWRYFRDIAAVSTYCAKMGIGVIIISSKRTFINSLKQLMDGKAKSISLKKRWKSWPQQIVILCQFPGIGISRAKKALRVYGNLQSIFNADIESLAKIIGKKNAETMKELLTQAVDLNGNRKTFNRPDKARPQSGGE